MGSALPCRFQTGGDITSSFNFRFISHTTRVSKHGLGLAVDINTLYNPYTKTVDNERIVEPVTGEPYLDRDAAFDYKIEKGDLCYNLFIEHGFEWGGEWTSVKDYQHFEVPDDTRRTEHVRIACTRGPRRGPLGPTRAIGHLERP